MCLDLNKIIQKNAAPRGAISPLPIALDGLFKLDIDDDIWQDIGLTSETDDMTEIPAWLGNNGVRDGIKALLEHDCCIEEMERVKHERISMQEWFKEEWEVVKEAIAITEDVNVLFQLNRHRDHLLRLCVTWELVVRGIPCTMSRNNWGPSLEEMKKAYKYEFEKQVMQHGDSDSDLEDENIDLNEEENIEDAEFIDNLEMSAFLDQFDDQL